MMTTDKAMVDRKQPIPGGRFLMPLLVFLAACAGQEQEQEQREKWIGHYEAPGVDVEFPVFMELAISAGVVSGRSADSTEVATVKGTVDGDKYELLLHPLDEGESTDQDIYFRGTRTGDIITGEWEHVVGVGGPWTARITELDEREALQLYQSPCEDEKVAESKPSCAGGA